MNLEVDVERLLLAHKSVRAELLSERAAGGHWVGHVASSPLATATAISALVTAHHSDTVAALRDSMSGRSQVIEQLVQGDLSELLVESVHWLARHQNPDGGWGDCEGAQSNIAATMLVQAAFRLTGIPAKFADLMVRADEFVEGQGGVAGLRQRYGKDKTLLASILANCALAGMVPWRQVPMLRYELGCLPKRWRQRIQLPVAEHAVPLFIAAGWARFHHDPPRNPITRLLRRSMRAKSLAILERLQAADDSFLGSPAFTAFVVMSLASIGCQDHAVVRRGVEFLLTSVRADSSWPVAANLAVTNTTLSLDSLALDEVPTIGAGWSARSTTDWEDTTGAGENARDAVVSANSRQTHQNYSEGSGDRVFNERTLNWLLGCQRTESNALTEVPPGGWAEGDSAGELPNTIDTARALSSLSYWRLADNELQRERLQRAAQRGVAWLLDLQNEDGGWPTFCRARSTPRGRVSPTIGKQERITYVEGDTSAADVTAHVLRALAAWSRPAEAVATERINAAIESGFEYLQFQQCEDGSFIPLWFGNEHHPDEHNLVCGTALVLAMCADLRRLDTDMAQRAARWLVSAQHSGGGWGPPRAPVAYSGAEKDGFRAWRANDAMAKFSSVEETALAVTALLPLANAGPLFVPACSRGLTWLINAVEQDAHRRPAAIGYYLSRLWYHERLYPLVFASGALTRAAPIDKRTAGSPRGLRNSGNSADAVLGHRGLEPRYMALDKLRP